MKILNDLFEKKHLLKKDVKADSEKVYKIILKTPLTDLEKERIYFYTYHYDSINSPTIYNISERFDLDFIGWNNFNDVLLCKKI